MCKQLVFSSCEEYEVSFDALPFHFPLQIAGLTIAYPIYVYAIGSADYVEVFQVAAKHISGITLIVGPKIESLLESVSSFKRTSS